ncbi:MAG: hypothetical protein KBS51_01880 [Lachnospiraceae bacterium]|nr:hypothetical protein [Candidatus Darwinimomas equi]
MFLDFHYYATYCAAYLAGYTHEESLDVAYAAQFVDCCTLTLLKKLKGPKAAVTTQYIAEMVDDTEDYIGLQRITRIWSAYHFLPYDLYAKSKKRPKRYMDRYRLICEPNGDLLIETVNLAKDRDLTAVGLAMHVLADTWAHRHFAGVGSNVINDINPYFYELIDDENETTTERLVEFRHAPGGDDFEHSRYNNSIGQDSEASIMCIGHGRLGHMPDYSFIRYKYMPAWGDYEVIVKDNPSDYYHAFCQMIYAMKYLRGEHPAFDKDVYDFDAVKPWEDEIKAMLLTRQYDHEKEWKEMCSKISGHDVEDFDIDKYQQEYIDAGETGADGTFLGRFFINAMRQKSMVTHRIFESGNLLAGFSVDYKTEGFKGIKDFGKLLESMRGGKDND